MDAATDALPEPRTFLVERYWPDIDEPRARRLAASLERAAQAMAAEGITVEHVGSILMPRDRVVFSLIQATDEASARQLTARVDAPADRIAVAIRLTERDRCTER
jgi:hypothetical protein